MAFQRGSQINPALGMVDYSPIARGGEAMARGKAAGTQAVVSGALGGLDAFMSGLQKAEQNKKAEKEMQGVIKMASSLAKSMAPLASKIDPGFSAQIDAISQSISDPSLPTEDRAAQARVAMEFLPNVINKGIKLFDMEQESAARQAQAAAKAQEQARAAAINDLANRMAMGQPVSGPYAPEIINEAAVKAAQLQKSSQRTVRSTDASGRPVQTTYGLGMEPTTSPIQEPPRNATPQEAAAVKMAEAEATGRMGVLTKQAESDIEAGKTALRLKPQYAELAKLLESGELKTDKLAPFKTAAMGIMKGLNIDVDEKRLANAELATSYFLQAMLDKVQYTRGAVSNKEGEWFAQMGPQLGKSTEANKRIIAAINARIDLDRKVGVMVESSLARGESYDKIQQKKQKLIEEYENKLGEPIKAPASRFNIIEVR